MSDVVSPPPLASHPFDSKAAAVATNIAADEDAAFTSGDECGISSAQNPSAKHRASTHYAVDCWMVSPFGDDVLDDVSNYPAEIREDLIAVVLSSLFPDHHQFSGDIETHDATKCACAECCMEELAKRFGFREELLAEMRGSASSPNDAGGDAAATKQTDSESDNEKLLVVKNVNAASILPRFFWYRHEALNCFGDKGIIASIAAISDSESDDDDENMEDEVVEGQAAVMTSHEPLPSAATDESMVDANPQASVATDAPPQVAGEGVLEEEIMFKSKSGNKKRITIVRQAEQPQDTLTIPPAFADGTASAGNSYNDALRALQYRLQKHGFLADPKTYLGRGRGEELYDKNDSLFDAEEDIPVLMSEDDSDLASEDEHDVLDINAMLLPEQGYNQSEFTFVMDAENEEEEETVEFSSNKRGKKEKPPRTLLVCKYKLPFGRYTHVYTPRAWRSLERKKTLPPMVKALFLALEYIVGGKRLRILQRSVFETFEFVDVDPADANSLRLSMNGKRQIRRVISLIFEASFFTFLMPYTVRDPKQLPKFLRYLKPVIAGGRSPQVDAAVSAAPAAESVTPNVTIGNDRSPVVELESATVLPTGGPPTTGLPVLETVETEAVGSFDHLLPLCRGMPALIKEIAITKISPYAPFGIEFYSSNLWISIAEMELTIYWSRMDDYCSLVGAVTDVVLQNFKGTHDKDFALLVSTLSYGMLSDPPQKEWEECFSPAAITPLLASVDQLKKCLDLMAADNVPVKVQESVAAELEELRNDGTITSDEAHPPEDLRWREVLVGAFARSLDAWWQKHLSAKGDRLSSPTEASEADQQAASQFTKSADCKSMLRDFVGYMNEEAEDSPPLPPYLNEDSTHRTVTDYFNASLAETSTANGSKRRRDQQLIAEANAASAPAPNRLGGADDDAGSAQAAVGATDKRKRIRNVVGELLQSHAVRLTDMLGAAPLLLPIPLGVVVQCAKESTSGQGHTSHVMILSLLRIRSLSQVEVRLVKFEPVLPEPCASEIRGLVTKDASEDGVIRDVADFIDKIGNIKRMTVEGRARSVMYAGFDNLTKLFGCVCFPLEYPTLYEVAGPGAQVTRAGLMLGGGSSFQTLRREDFVSSEAATLKSRLSLLDLITAHLWLQYYTPVDGEVVSEEKPPLTLSLLFTNSVDDQAVEPFEPSAALMRAILNSGDVNPTWKDQLDRYVFAQVAYLKCWLMHLRNARSSFSASLPSTKVFS